MERWRHFARNAGTGGVLKTVILHAAIILITTFATRDGTGWTLPLLAVIAWSLPALLRKSLAVAPEKTRRLLNIAGVLIMGGAFIAGFVREQIDDGVLLHTVIAALSAYCSAYFWFLSDPEVVRLPAR